MGNIEHCEDYWRYVWICDECDAQQDDSGTKVCWQCGSGEWEEVQVVRAADLRGAVEALEQIENELGNPDRLPWELRHLPGVARAALKRARGQ